MKHRELTPMKIRELGVCAHDLGDRGFLEGKSQIFSHECLELERFYSFSFNYEVIVVKGTILRASVQPVFVKSVDHFPLYIGMADLDPDGLSPTEYTIGVRIRTASGHRSTMNYFAHIVYYPKPKTHIWIYVIVSMLFVILASTAAIILVIRKRYASLADNANIAIWRSGQGDGSNHVLEAVTDDDVPLVSP